MAGGFNLSLGLDFLNYKVSAEPVKCDPKVQSCENEEIDFSAFDSSLQCIDEYVSLGDLGINLKLVLPSNFINFKLDF